MARWLYTALLYLALPVILLRLWWRGRKAPAYRLRWRERLGFVPRQGTRPLWIHGVSVGETVAIAPLVELLLARHPDLPLLLTTTTPTGSQRVRALFGDRVQHVYCPWDLPDALGRFLRRTRPLGCIIVETELWPNLVHACQGAAVPVLLANARLSARSARGYARFAALTRPMLQRLDRVVAQHDSDGERFVALGLPAQQLSISGSIKLDIEIRPQWLEAGARLRALWGERPVLVAGSTHEGEDAALLRVLRHLRGPFPDLLLVLVPRHPERFESVYCLCCDAGWTVARHSEPGARAAADVYLVDTMGELMGVYAAADVAFVGGSLVPRGGHNPLEPAALGKPVLMGQQVFNFQAICDALERAGGLVRVADEQALTRELQRLLADRSLREREGRAARAFIEQNRGALERLYREVAAMLRL
ncbi:lipid IV(A) 3-deoxy-D-manno-octulosonic acid transferase [Marinobacterium rhizophilum]|uniref:3-deoxy-D-manno-octulosonic acid transferase n=1 Tax=Marinobacterium rhizophilum TaxID=420402 RepID=A0ABY5HH45_9GAMM|nr:lipid IV(A) 3-deoxy-D-manno-octulosonic acid transferase [Marinobacterium rhizophilum]UTW10580.1 lipid IV(A) 3-deoxy-D-manno-octulosonic acid transferase [Marinobacterium rhizophilum]